jgi:hypothetical protein
MRCLTLPHPLQVVTFSSSPTPCPPACARYTKLRLGLKKALAEQEAVLDLAVAHGDPSLTHGSLSPSQGMDESCQPAVPAGRSALAVVAEERRRVAEATEAVRAAIAARSTHASAHRREGVTAELERVRCAKEAAMKPGRAAGWTVQEPRTPCSPSGAPTDLVCHVDHADGRRTSMVLEVVAGPGGSMVLKEVTMHHSVPGQSLTQHQRVVAERKEWVDLLKWALERTRVEATLRAAASPDAVREVCSTSS